MNLVLYQKAERMHYFKNRFCISVIGTLNSDQFANKIIKKHTLALNVKNNTTKIKIKILAIGTFK